MIVDRRRPRPMGREPKPDAHALDEVRRLIGEGYSKTRACQIVAVAVDPFGRHTARRLSKKITQLEKSNAP
jgi:hypothetical protein